jgi:hypothetical protein
MTEQVVQIPFVTTGFIKCAPMLLRYKTGYRQQERGSLRTRQPASSVIRSASASPASHTSRIGTVSPPPACDESGIPQHGDVRRGGLPQGTSSRLNTMLLKRGMPRRLAFHARSDRRHLLHLLDWWMYSTLSSISPCGSSVVIAQPMELVADRITANGLSGHLIEFHG